MKKGPRGLIDRFAEHRVAANLLMLLLLLLGGWSLFRLNTQFLPTFELNFISVTIIWKGANADDVERSITTPLETELRDLDNLKEMKSISREGSAIINIEFEQGADMGYALDEVKERVALVRDLPEDSERPIVQRLINYEPIAKILITGTDDRNKLRYLAHRFERELLDRGIAKVEITGLPEQEIAIQIPTEKLAELHLSLDKVADIIRTRSQDIPAGTIGKDEVGRKLRSLNQQRNVKGFSELPLITDRQGQLLRVGDVATITRRARENQVTLEYQKKPAVQLALLRSESANALKSARIFQDWLKDARQKLPPNIKLHVFDERWKLIKQRISILFWNGVAGFILINIILFLFLNHHVAFWVSMGIPISLLSAMIILLMINGSINMVSMFAFIMTLGIVVDDTIVVGEEALSLITKGKDVLTSVKEAAHKMLPPISASSLTTIAAFFPLMFITGIIGTVLLQIPLVVICVISASLLECFLVLPGHLYHSMKRGIKSHGIRNTLDQKFSHFRDVTFRNFITKAINNRLITLTTATAIFLVALGFLAGGRINFTFFPSPDSTIIRANIEFSAGTTEANVDRFIEQLNKTLFATNTELSEKDKSTLVTALTVRKELASERLEIPEGQGDEYAHIMVELTEPDERNVTNAEFIQHWRAKIDVPPNVQNFTITAPQAGPPGKDIDISLSGTNWESIKLAAAALKAKLSTYSGISDIKDDLPFGQQEYIFDPSAMGKALGLTTDNIGRQLRAAFTGELVQIFHEVDEEVEVRVTLPEKERNQLMTLESLPIITPQGEITPLTNVVDLVSISGLNILRHTNTRLTTHVTAEVDERTTNANKILDELKSTAIPSIEQQFTVKARYKGRAEEQAETIRDMKIGTVVALTLIYIILAWVFASYTLPLLIMLAIPLGVTGAIFGHLLMGKDLTILSLFGLFGLSGIVINDSIILVNRYLKLRGTMETKEAIIETTCQRLRAVLLTSLTTIAGLAPLLFETSLQAQFLIPMAISISFGLMFSTLLILVVVPCLLLIHQTRTRFLSHSRRKQLQKS